MHTGSQSQCDPRAPYFNISGQLAATRAHLTLWKNIPFFSVVKYLGLLINAHLHSGYTLNTTDWAGLGFDNWSYTQKTPFEKKKTKIFWYILFGVIWYKDKVRPAFEIMVNNYYPSGCVRLVFVASG